MANIINMRLTDEQVSFLNKVAHDNGLYKSGRELSPSKALKFLLNSHMISEENGDEKSKENDVKNIERMLEHIYICMPHLIQSSHISALASLEGVNSERAQKIRDSSIENLNKTCGQMQEISCKYSYPSYNNRSIRTIPIDEERSEWK